MAVLRHSMPPVITIVRAAMDGTATLRLSIRSELDGVVVTVANTGSWSPTSPERAFESFFTEAQRV